MTNIEVIRQMDSEQLGRLFANIAGKYLCGAESWLYFSGNTINDVANEYAKLLNEECEDPEKFLSSYTK